VTGIYAAPLWLLPAAALTVAGRSVDQLLGWPSTAPLPGLGLLLILAGALLSAAALRENWIVRRASGSPDPSRPPLPEAGPYWFIRHPLDAGCHLALLGAAVLLRSITSLIAAGPLALLLWTGNALFLEERSLVRRYPRVYARYRADTGLLWPSIYAWSITVLLCYYRIFFGLRIHGARRVPRSGPFFLIGLHRTYMDPFLFSCGTPRKVHYLATSVLFRHPPIARYFRKLGCIPLVRSRADLRAISAALKILDDGGVAGLFPEGGLSWYGETACEPAVSKLLAKRRVPIVTAELAGGYTYYPRYTRRGKRHALRLQYRVYPAGSRTAQRLMQEMARRERLRDAELRAKGRPQQARGAEELVYVCPQCRTPFHCLGFPDGDIRCRACGARFKLLQGKGLDVPGKAPLTLPELERRCLQWTGRFEPNGLKIPGHLIARFTKKAGLDLRSAHRLRRRDRRGARPGWLVLQPDRVVAQFADGGRKGIRYEDLSSVLVEGNRKLELFYRSSDGKRGYLLFIPPQRYALFLQHFLRLRAFGNPYSRYRGSRRAALDEMIPGRNAGAVFPGLRRAVD
jgi:protein-S-isoprenylcysteine O-methyltransferase Ste14/DNA-directed RNA polymerase subunit RPC12/RpoP